MQSNELSEFKKTFSGNIILPQDATYETASSVLMRKGSPAIIFECRTPEDVTHAIRYARDKKLVISVRSGGHSNAGLSTNNGGAIIDVRPMNDISVVDKARHRVRVGAGAHWGDIAKALQPHGLAISAGDTVSVGASGLSLGGGIGWMVRKYGLAIDSLKSADLVTADGELLTVDADNHDDLFWAIRGGGGNFGIITALEFTAHPVKDVYFGTIAYPAANPASLLKNWRNYMRTASEDLTTTVTLVPSMGEGMPSVIAVTACWNGDNDAEAQAALDPLRKLADTMMNDSIKKQHYYEILEEARVPNGLHSEINNAFFHDFSDTVIDKIAAHYSSVDKAFFQIRGLGGEMSRVPVQATAFAHRASEVMVLMPLFLPLGSTEAQIQSALEPWYDIAKDGQGSYVNFFSRATPRETAAAYPPATLQRLAAIKKQYDPENVFNQNINIKPAA